MRAVRLVLIALGLCGLLAGGARAGLYHPAEPAATPSVDYRRFRETLNDLRSVAVTQPESPLRRHYLQQVAELEAKARTLGLTTEDRVNLSAYLIRLQQAPRALEVLKPAATAGQENFMVWANLGTAYQLADQPDRAIDALRQALKVWPALWPGLTMAQLDAYRRAEMKHLELLRLRQQAAVRGRPGATPGTLALDELFPRVRFVGESGRYEAGELAAAQRAELPPDALALTEQLVLWLPNDPALYWLLGELLNARGDVGNAASILEELVFVQRLNAPELRQHRQVLNEAKALAGKLGPLVREGQMLWVLAPRGATAGPAAGLLLGETGWAAAAELRRREQEPALEMPRTPAAATPPAPPADWRPDTRQVIVVGGVAGVVVVLLAYLQVREFRRRRPGSAAASRG